MCAQLTHTFFANQKVKRWHCSTFFVPAVCQLTPSQNPTWPWPTWADPDKSGQTDQLACMPNQSHYWSTKSQKEDACSTFFCASSLPTRHISKQPTPSLQQPTTRVMTVYTTPPKGARLSNCQSELYPPTTLWGEYLGYASTPLHHLLTTPHERCRAVGQNIQLCCRHQFVASTVSITFLLSQ